MKEPSAGYEGAPLYVVDGYNVIFGGRFSHKGGSVEDSRERLMRLLASYGRKKRVEITVVWDGKGGPRGSARDGPAPAGRGAVRSRFAGAGRSADDAIVRIVERSERRKRITVVSDDRRHITGVVKNLGAKAMGVEAFLDLVGFGVGGKPARRRAVSPAAARGADDPQREKRGADDLSVEGWLKLFEARKK